MCTYGAEYTDIEGAGAHSGISLVSLSIMESLFLLCFSLLLAVSFFLQREITNTIQELQIEWWTAFVPLPVQVVTTFVMVMSHQNSLPEYSHHSSWVLCA